MRKMLKLIGHASTITLNYPNSFSIPKALERMITD